MTVLTRLPDILTAAAGGRGPAGVAVVERPGCVPSAYWVPDAVEEPAFLAYSVTKTFTATLILWLCEDGRLSLEDRLATWFPRIADADRISIRMLLNHTAGIPDYGSLSSYHQSVRLTPSQPWSFERFGMETYERGLLFAPGEGWSYSNPGYMLLKSIAEVVAGLPYGVLVSERIARPLGLRRTAVANSVQDLGALAPGRSSALAPDGAARDVRSHYHPGWVSHGVVTSTPSEVVRFIDGLFRGELLSRHSIAEMTTLVARPADPLAASIGEGSRSRRGQPGYGLGLMGDPASPWGLILGHNGGGPGYSASAFHAAELGGASACAMGAIEHDFSAEGVVFDVLDRLAAGIPDGRG